MSCQTQHPELNQPSTNKLLNIIQVKILLCSLTLLNINVNKKAKNTENIKPDKNPRITITVTFGLIFSSGITAGSITFKAYCSLTLANIDFLCF